MDLFRVSSSFLCRMNLNLLIRQVTRKRALTDLIAYVCPERFSL